MEKEQQEHALAWARDKGRKPGDRLVVERKPAGGGGAIERLEKRIEKI